MSAVFGLESSSSRAGEEGAWKQTTSPCPQYCPNVTSSKLGAGSWDVAVEPSTPKRVTACPHVSGSKPRAKRRVCVRPPQREPNARQQEQYRDLEDDELHLPRQNNLAKRPPPPGATRPIIGLLNIEPTWLRTLPAPTTHIINDCRKQSGSNAQSASAAYNKRQFKTHNKTL